jgi:hypothetical protein
MEADPRPTCARTGAGGGRHPRPGGLQPDRRGRRLSSMMREHGIASLDELGGRVVSRSRAGMAAAIARLPQGSWRNRMRINGSTNRSTWKASVTIAGDHVAVDLPAPRLASPPRISLPDVLHSGLHRLRREVPRGTRRPQRCRHAGRSAGDGAGEQHRQRAPSPPPRWTRARHHRPHAARCGVRRAAPVLPGGCGRPRAPPTCGT